MMLMYVAGLVLPCVGGELKTLHWETTVEHELKTLFKNSHLIYEKGDTSHTTLQRALL